MVALDVRLALLTKWPEWEDLLRTIPQCFQFAFGKKTTVIIDCFEIFYLQAIQSSGQGADILFVQAS